MKQLLTEFRTPLTIVLCSGIVVLVQAWRTVRMEEHLTPAAESRPAIAQIRTLAADMDTVKTLLRKIAGDSSSANEEE